MSVKTMHKGHDHVSKELKPMPGSKRICISGNDDVDKMNIESSLDSASMAHPHKSCSSRWQGHMPASVEAWSDTSSEEGSEPGESINEAASIASADDLTKDQTRKGGYLLTGDPLSL